MLFSVTYFYKSVTVLYHKLGNISTLTKCACVLLVFESVSEYLKCLKDSLWFPYSCALTANRENRIILYHSAKKNEIHLQIRQKGDSMSNRLQFETSPYLLQHKDNPVDWYPWCGEAFSRARAEDKPVFLSIGYSACHWCHVMAHESFEDEEIAEILNRCFISVKVDREERPDIDNVYMTACQAFTGSGGWPASIFLTPEQKPFFAGTYFPKNSRSGITGFRELLLLIHEKWQNDRGALLHQANVIVAHLKRQSAAEENDSKGQRGSKSQSCSKDQSSSGSGQSSTVFGPEHGKPGLAEQAVELYRRVFDRKNGGFGTAPKFPAPHNLLFLISRYQRTRDMDCLMMAQITLLQMYRGGLFDHIGYGFCRYATDDRFLVPHFEKMLYDNAMLILAYSRMYPVSGKKIYLDIAEKTADFILEEMTLPEGGFAGALDADSEGEEGKYYLFTPEEIRNVLGQKDGDAFNRRFDITEGGNFQGKNIPNLLNSDLGEAVSETILKKLRSYRKERYALHLDQKVLTSWNSLMIAAMCGLYLVSRKELYLRAALNADRFIRKYLREKDTLFVSCCGGKRGVQGFLDDYAGYIYALLALHRATLKGEYLEEACRLTDKTAADFKDSTGGFYLYSKSSENLIIRPKETFDGAIPSGNSLMAWNLVRLSLLTDERKYEDGAKEQLDFLSGYASQNPLGYAMALTSLLEYEEPSAKVTVVSDGQADAAQTALLFPPDFAVLFRKPSAEQPLLNGKTTYYVCRGKLCLPPVNDLGKL